VLINAKNKFRVNSGSYKAFSSGQLTIVSSSKVRTIHALYIIYKED